jgi:hypothetical protein
MSLKNWIKLVESEKVDEATVPPGSIAIPSLSGQGNVAPALLKIQGNDPTLQNVLKQAAMDKKLVSVGSVPTGSAAPAGQVKNQQQAQQQKPAQGATMSTMQTASTAQPVQEDDLAEVAPPGMEDTVLALKKKFPGQEGRAYAIAWSQYNKKHGKDKANESMDLSMKTKSQSIMEGTLDEILANHPHEHRMCQEGWGMDVSLYEALCDHYYKEGKIPRSVWHGSAEDLRRHVEECYAQDTGMVLGEADMEEGIAGSALGAVAGAALGGPVGAVRGAMVGNELQDTFASEGADMMDEESNLERDIRDAAMRQVKDEMDEDMFESKFTKLSKKLSKQPGVTDPDALAASIGRKKLGQAEMTRRSKAGRADESVEESVMDKLKTAGKAVKKAVGKAVDKIAPGDEELLQRLEKETGGKRPAKKGEKVKEATDRSEPGKVKHTADAGGYGRKDDEDEEGKKVVSTVKRGRGRPKKGGDETGEVKKYDWSAFGVGGKDIKLSKWDKKKTIKHKIKDSVGNKDADQLDELSPKTLGRYVKSASADAKMKGYDAGAADWGGDEASKHPSKKNWHGASLDDKAHKRLKNIGKAVDKMTNESTDPMIENWDKQLKTLLKEGTEVAVAPVAQPAVKPRAPAGADPLAALKALLGGAGVGSDAAVGSEAEAEDLESHGIPSSTVATIQSGVNMPVNDKESEPGLADPRNNPVSGQIFVPQLAMPRGMGMSVEGDVHAHHIDVDPAAPDEVIDALAGDSEQSDANSTLDFIKRLIGDRNGQGEAKLIVPAMDYEPETAEPQAADDEQYDTFGHNTIAPDAVEVGIAEDDEGDTAAFSDDAEINASLAQSYDADKSVNQDKNVSIDEEALDQPGTFEDKDAESMCECGSGMYEAKCGCKTNESTLFSRLLKMFEGAKPDYIDLDKDGDKKETMKKAAADKEEKEEVDESTGVTDFEPKSQGGTRKELLAKYHKSGDPKDAEAARKAGATQKELKGEKTKVDEWANTPNSGSKDEAFQTDIDFMTKFISGGLNNMKQDQTTVPSARVVTKAEAKNVDLSMAAQLKKLAGLN